MNIFLRFKKHLFKFINSGISNDHNLEEVRKTQVFNLFTIIGILFLLPLGINAIIKNLYTLGFVLLGVAFFIYMNYIFLKITHNTKVSSYSISLFLFFFMTYMIYDGGVANTGPLWIYPLPIIFMFILGFRKGLFFIIVFITFNALILFFPNESGLNAVYTNDFKLRMLLSLMLITFFASGYEYLREKSFVDMKALKKEVEDLSRQDPLTGLYNRRVYQNDLSTLKGSMGAILICDIDNFKNINDLYGHAVGDNVLVKIAECIRKNIRKEDLAIRWGGEEFFIYLNNSTLENAYIISEKLRKSIASLSIYHSDNIAINTTMSIGVSIIDGTLTFDEAIRNADCAMYRAKKAGRNRTEVYYDGPEEIDFYI